MKLKTIFASLGLALCVAVGGVAAFANKLTEAKPASAAGNVKHFFIDCTNCDGWDSESLCIHTWNGSSDVYVEATQVSDNYWYVELDITGCGGYRWYRCAKGNTGTRWNESGWHTGMSDNYCAINGWDNAGSFSGSTSGCEETYEVASTSPSTLTKRIWIDPKDNFYDGNARPALRTFSGANHLKTYILGGSSQFCVVGGQYLFYVDIPVSADCQLVRLHNAFNFVWTYGGNFSNISGYNTANIVYSWNTAAEYSAGNEGSATVEYAKALLDGYSTCLSSADNGYGNINNIKTGVINKLSASDLATFRAATFSAPGYGTRTYGEKLDTMSNQNSVLSRNVVVAGGLITTDTPTIAIIIVVTVIALTAVGGYVFFKRKEQH